MTKHVHTLSIYRCFSRTCYFSMFVGVAMVPRLTLRMQPKGCFIGSGDAFPRDPSFLWPKMLKFSGQIYRYRISSPRCPKDLTMQSETFSTLCGTSRRVSSLHLVLSHCREPVSTWKRCKLLKSQLLVLSHRRLSRLRPKLILYSFSLVQHRIPTDSKYIYIHMFWVCISYVTQHGNVF